MTIKGEIDRLGRVFPFPRENVHVCRTLSNSDPSTGINLQSTSDLKLKTLITKQKNTPLEKK